MQMLRVFQNIEEAALHFTEKWIEISHDVLGKQSFFSVALSGGETPIPFYRNLAESDSMFPWDRTHLFLVDERFVPPDHPDSNFRMIKSNLINHVGIPSDNIHCIVTGEVSPQRAADLYELDIRHFFHLPEHRFPRFDLILLGIGEDGHTASLFPDHPVLAEQQKIALAVMMDQRGHDRITLTLPVLNRAKNIIFLLTGAKKASILNEIVKSENQFLPKTPAALVKPDEGNVYFLADAAAGSEVSY
jgi:6-phosphogluconolactonase